MDLKGATLNTSDIIGRITGPDGRDVRGGAFGVRFGCNTSVLVRRRKPNAFVNLPVAHQLNTKINRIR